MINKSEARVMKINKDTLGGPTYYVRINGKTKPLCFRRLKNQEDFHCTHPAGYMTDHPGAGACKYHGGARKTPTISTGVYAVQTRKRLQDKINEYMYKTRDELLDLTEQLAATRAIFDEFIEAFPTTDTEEYGVWFNRFNSLISTIGTLVEKISRVDSRNTLTAAQVLYLRAIMIDMFMKYLPDPDIRERAVTELAARMGGDLEIDMKPSEISMPRQLVDSNYVENE